MVELSGLKLLDICGLERQELDGQFSEQALAKLFIDEWVPYYECHKCSRVDYCKFPEPVVPGSSRMRDIQCGVVVRALHNFVRVTFSILDSLTPDQLQSYLDGTYHLSQFLFDTEIRIGSSMDDGYVDYLEDWAPAFFGRFVHLRDHLNGMATAFSNIPELRAEKGVLLVEGQSEKAFIERLKLSHLSWFLHIQVDSYGGKGSRGPKRLEMLLKKLASLGYRIYIQGDADGGATNIFDALIARGLVECKETFVFQKDFETAVPPKLAYTALRRLGFLQDVSRDEFNSIVGKRSSKLGVTLQDEFGINLESIKIQFAKTVADVINWSRDWTWHHDKEFLETELGKFLLFLRKIY